MKDEEIEKALDIHKVFGKCNNCPYYEGEPVCSTRLLRDVSDYITRLKAENAKLQEWKHKQQICNETNTERIMQLTDEKEQIRKETAREIYDFAKDFFEWDEEGFCRELLDLIKQKYGIGDRE